MLGWLCVWPWSLAWPIMGASRRYDLGQFLVCPTDSDTNSTGGCTVISVSPVFFFLSCSGFLPPLPRLLSYPPPSIVYFYFPFWPWSLQSLALATLWHTSLIAVEGKVLSGWEWTQGRAGWVDSGSTVNSGYWIENMVWGTSQTRSSLTGSRVCSSHPAACSALCFNLRQT